MKKITSRIVRPPRQNTYLMKCWIFCFLRNSSPASFFRRFLVFSLFED